MSRTYRRFSEPILVLLLVLFLSAWALAQTRAGAAVRPRNANASLAGQSNPAVGVSPGAWSQLGQLIPSASNAFYAIGYAVAIDGDTIAVGSLPSFAPNNVAAYIFIKPANGWRNLHSVASLFVPAGAGFLVSIAMQGDTIVVGDSDADNGPGTAYVFVKPAGGWTDMTPTATLSSSDSMANDYFGGSVAISGDTIVIGASGDNSYTGATYVYVKPANGWTDMTETAKLTASDGQPYDFMGGAVSISGNTVVAGATQKYPSNGKAYVFVEPPTGWADVNQTAELTASDGQAGGRFGASVSISNDTILVGAVDLSTAFGAAYVYIKPASGWNNSTQTAELSPADGLVYFGTPVLISGKTAIVGAPQRSRGENFEEGGAYVFSEPTGGWKNLASNTVLTGSDARHFTWFGDSLAMSGNTLVVGAPAFSLYGMAFVFGLP
jgi:FG-GAP repeat